MRFITNEINLCERIEIICSDNADSSFFQMLHMTKLSLSLEEIE